MELPALDETLDRSLVAAIETGTGGDVTLVLRPPSWCGRSASAPAIVRLTFEAAADPRGLNDYAGRLRAEERELARLRYAFGLRPTPGNVAVDLIGDLDGETFRVRCDGVRLEIPGSEA
jgi:hypothetical protein